MFAEEMDMNELGKEEYSMNMQGKMQPGKSKGPSPEEMADIVISQIQLHPSYYKNREKMWAFLDIFTTKLADEVESGGLRSIDYDKKMLKVEPSSLNENKSTKMKKKNVLNEEIGRIKNMMKKINESRFFSDKGEFLGGPDPSWEDEGDESFGEDVDEHIRNNFPELFDNIEYDIEYDRDRHGDERQKIKITMKDGSDLSFEFKDSLENEFNVIGDGDNFITVARSYSGPEPDFD